MTESIKTRLMTLATQVSASPHQAEATATHRQHAENVDHHRSVPAFPTGVAATPLEFTRVSIFRILNGRARRIDISEELPSRRDISVTFQGDELDRADEDVWLQCLRLASGEGYGKRVYTTRYAFLMETKRDNGSKTRRWLSESLDRLTKARIRLTTKRSGRNIRVATVLLHAWGIDENTATMYFVVSPDAAVLFEALAYIDWEARLSLSEAGKALYAYSCGHKRGVRHSINADYLALWCGYRGRQRQFRERQLKAALVELKNAGIFKNTGIRKDGPGLYIATWTLVKIAG